MVAAAVAGGAIEPPTNGIFGGPDLQLRHV